MLPPDKKTAFTGVAILLILTIFSCGNDTRKITGTGGIKGYAVMVEGNVRIKGLPVKTGADIPDGSVITTGKDSYCEITFLGQNIIRVYENSLIRLSFSEAMISVDRGTAAAVLRNIKTLLKKEGDLFEVESGNVVAGIRGTSFFLAKEDPETTYFCLCNGSIKISDPTENLEIPLQAVHHKGIRLKEINNQVQLSRAGMEYHSDEDLENLAARIGQEMVWTVQE